MESSNFQPIHKRFSPMPRGPSLLPPLPAPEAQLGAAAAGKVQKGAAAHPVVMDDLPNGYSTPVVTTGDPPRLKKPQTDVCWIVFVDPMTYIVLVIMYYVMMTVTAVGKIIVLTIIVLTIIVLTIIVLTL